MTCGRKIESFRSSFASCPPCFVARAQSENKLIDELISAAVERFAAEFQIFD